MGHKAFEKALEPSSLPYPELRLDPSRPIAKPCNPHPRLPCPAFALPRLLALAPRPTQPSLRNAPQSTTLKSWMPLCETVLIKSLGGTWNLPGPHQNAAGPPLGSREKLAGLPKAGHGTCHFWQGALAPSRTLAWPGPSGTRRNPRRNPHEKCNGATATSIF